MATTLGSAESLGTLNRNRISYIGTPSLTSNLDLQSLHRLESKLEGPRTPKFDTTE